MNGEKSIEPVSDELSAVHRRTCFHLCDDLGCDLLSGFFRRTAIPEMMHVKQLSERIC